MTAIATARLMLYCPGCINMEAPKVGGWSNTDQNEEVQAAAEFAVNAINAKSNSLTPFTLKSVDKSTRQVVAGVNFKMDLTLEKDGNSSTHSVKVYRNLSQEFSLSEHTQN